MAALAPVRRSFDAITRTGIRHPWLVLAVGLLCGGIGVWRAGSLTIDQDFRALVPDDFPSVLHLNELEDRVGTQSELVVEIRGPSRDANLALGRELVERVRAMKGDFSEVEIRREMGWFKDRALLYLPLADLLDLRRRVIDRIREEVETEMVEDVAGDRKPTPTDPDEDDPLDLDDDELEERYADHVPKEYYEVTDGDLHVLALRARPTVGSTDMGFTRRIIAAVNAAIADLDPPSYHAGTTARIRGEYADFDGEMTSVRDDVLGSSLYALGLLLLVLVFQFRRLRAVPLLLIPLVLSVLTTLAAATWLYEALNVISAFIFVILLGLGIDFGIHLLSRYEFERLRGRAREDALRLSATTTGVDVATGAATTTAMFCLFPIADFRGFSQLGVIAAFGIVFAFVFTLAMLPALITLMERVRPWTSREWLSLVGRAMARGRPPLWMHGLSVWVVVITIVLMGLGVYSARTLEFEYDLAKLGSNLIEDTPDDPDTKDFADALGRPDFGPALAMADTPEQGRALTAQLRGISAITDAQLEALLGFPQPRDERRDLPEEPSAAAPAPTKAPEGDFDDEDDPFSEAALDPFSELQTEVDAGPLSSDSRDVLDLYGIVRLREMRYFLAEYASPWAFVPERQSDKLSIIRDIRRRVDNKWAALTAETRSSAERFRSYLAVEEPITFDGMPTWFQERWTDNQGIYGRHAVLYNRGNKSSSTEVQRLRASFLNLTLTSGEEAPVAATYYVIPDIIDTVIRDGPRVLGASLLAIVLCLLALFRSVRLTLLATIPLLSTLAWLLGVFWLAGWKVNLYNVITFPLMIGLAVDYGIHMVSRWAEEGGRKVLLTLRETGAAITSSSLTTCIGFSGLIVAQHVGLSTLGWTAGAGVALAFVASVTTLPAVLHIVGSRRR